MSMYTVLRFINHARVDEHTNVGVAIFNDPGNLVLWKADGPERAVARGDLRAEFADQWTQPKIESYLKSAFTVPALKHRLESIGHTMSYIQFREPLWTRVHSIETLDRLFDQFVLGKKPPPTPDAPTTINTVLR